MSGRQAFKVLGVEEAPSPDTDKSAVESRTAAVSRHMLMLALQALSQRALIAVSALFTVVLVASAWWLWYSVLGDPSPRQLVALGGYAVFVLLVEAVRRRK